VKIEFFEWKESVSSRTGKSKNDKMIYRYGNQLIAKEKMAQKSKYEFI